MHSVFRTSTALVASLSLVLGHVPFAAIAQDVTAAQCGETEDEAACLARRLQDAADAQAAAEAEATRLAEEAANAEQAAERAAAEQAAAEDAAQQAAEQAAAEEAARLAAEQAAEEAARLAAEEAARQAAADVEAAEAQARLLADQAQAEEAARLAADAAQSETSADPETVEAAPARDGEADQPLGTSPASDEAAAQTTEPTEVEQTAPVEAQSDAGAAAPTDAAPVSDANALADALAAAAGTNTDTSQAVPLSAEDEAALIAAQAAAAAAELAAAEPTDPVVEAQTEIATAEIAAEQAQQSLSLQAETAPVVGSVAEVITEETARRSDEDFGRLLTETTETDPSPTTGNDRSRLTGVQGLIIGGLAGLAIGSIITGNRQVVNRADDRLVVLRPEGDYEVIRDDDSLLRRPGNAVVTESFADGSSRNVITQPDGTQVITIRDADLRILRRTVVAPNGQRTVLIDEMVSRAPVVFSELPQARPSASNLATGQSDDAAVLARTLGTTSAADRGFSLAQVRSIRAVRDLAPAINLQNVTFATGSAAISPDQATQLLALGRYMSEAIAHDPREIFLIEGHTDATGSASLNLGLSDRRAETVALALTDYFGVPAQNMVIQGFGEEFLLVPTLENERLNRRVAVRRITDLLRVASSN